ncbi:MAG: type VI secretion system membrane subunit TssM [Planctomycetes bacterium]|nr:type VI secretion system membrane subunit TssM [Planctomycetota bacterium]
MNWLRSATGRLVVGIVLLALALLALAYIAKTLGVEPKVANLSALGVLGLFGVGFAVSQLRAGRAASQLEAALRAQGTSGMGAARPGQPTFEDLRKQFDESLGLLKQSRLGRGAIYKLPWFVIIGPPGSGKTTMLRESGLNFPYMTKGRAAIRGLGGTKNCDWWFADRGVLLDTAGRWTSEAEDRDEWLAFLDLLKKYRGRQPINGVVVAISLDDVAYRGATELQKLADDVRDRIDELTRRLEMLFPVYLVFTKCDGLIGFVESFSGMNRDQRAQVWGFTFPERLPPGQRFPDAFAAEFDQLGAQLGKRRLPQLVAEPTRRRRRLMFRLPQEFAGVRERLLQFVELIQQSNPYQEASAIRGCYFTSGTQERGALGDLLSEMARKAGVPVEDLEIPSGERKCYFVDDVFNKVVFADRDLAAPTHAAGRRRRVLQWLQLAAVAIGAVVLVWLEVGRFLWVQDHTGNIESYVREAEKGEPRQARLMALRNLDSIETAAPEGSDVKQSLQKRIATTAATELIGPAAALIASSSLPAVIAEPSGDLVQRLEALGKARQGLQDARAAATAKLAGEQRGQAFAPAIQQLLEQWQVSGRDLDLTMSLANRLVRDYQQPELWAATETQLAKLQNVFAGHEARLLELEQAVLNELDSDRGALFRRIAAAGAPLALERANLRTLESTAPLLSTMLPRAEVAPREDEAAQDFAGDVLASAQKLKDRLAALPIAPALDGRRNAALAQSLADFEQRDLPAWREKQWAALLAGLELRRSLVTPGDLVKNQEALREDLTRVLQLYAAGKAANQAELGNQVKKLLERLGGQFKPLPEAKDLVELTAAIGNLADAVTRERETAEADWSQALAERAATAAQAQAHLLGSVLARQLLFAKEQLRERFATLRQRHQQMSRSFPFTRDGDDCAPADFFLWLDTLREVHKAGRELPRIAAGNPASAELFPPPPADFLTLLDKAELLARRFGNDKREARVNLYAYETNLKSISITLDGQKVHETGPLISPKAGEVRLGRGTEGRLQVEVEQRSGRRLSLAELDTQDRWLREKKGPNGLPANFWALFRLGMTADKVTEAPPRTFSIPGIDPKHAALVVLKLRVDDTERRQNLFLILSGDDSDSQLLLLDPSTYRLDFPDFPWK